MATLTKRERVMRTIQLQETDRVPLYDLIQNDAVIEHYTGAKLTVENGFRNASYAIGCALDMTRSPGGPKQPGTVRLDSGFVVRQEPWTSWVMEKPFHDLSSLLAWVRTEIERLNHKVWDRAYRDSLYDRIRRFQAYSAAGDPTGRNDPTVFVLESEIGLTYMYSNEAGLEWFSYLMSDYPALVEEWLEARFQCELRRVATVANPDLIPVALTADDIAYKSATIFAPAWLRRYWCPRLKQLNDAWHQRDTAVVFHSDGNLWPVLDDLVAAGIDGLNPLEVLAGMTVKGVRERYPRLFLTGGIDVSQLLPFGTPAEVRTACQEAIRDSGGTGYFLGSSTELHWEVPLHNALAMFESAWETAGRQ
jgi:hypothetical protein